MSDAYWRAIKDAEHQIIKEEYCKLLVNYLKNGGLEEKEQEELKEFFLKKAGVSLKGLKEKNKKDWVNLLKFVQNTGVWCDLLETLSPFKGKKLEFSENRVYVWSLEEIIEL